MAAADFFQAPQIRSQQKNQFLGKNQGLIFLLVLHETVFVQRFRPLLGIITKKAFEISAIFFQNVREVRLPPDCKQVAHADVLTPWIGRDWWPDDDVLARSYTFFRCQADHTAYRFVAISKAGDRVLHWRTYAR
jgi:hypothetical protein